MKVSVINGCKGNTTLENKVVHEVFEQLETKNIEYSTRNLAEMKLHYCTGCDSCQKINPGICAINDGLNDVLKEFINSEVSIIITPIKFGCCNSITKNFIDRTEPLFLPYQASKNGKIVMQKRYKKYPSLIYIGVSEDNDSESEKAFEEAVGNSTLSMASDKVTVKIVNENQELHIESGDIL